MRICRIIKKVYDKVYVCVKYKKILRIRSVYFSIMSACVKQLIMILLNLYKNKILKIYQLLHNAHTTKNVLVRTYII